MTDAHGPVAAADFDFAPPPPSKGFSGISLNLQPSSSTFLAPDVSGIPPSPMSPMSPTGHDTMESKQKRGANPLTDLIDTERVFVDQLTGIIRKVAAAWSRSNLPPPELDTIFRSIEGVYKANRSLLAKLKEIGTNPSSPKALGDLLMRWIDDLEGPYTTYCSRFCGGFDDWEPIRNNSRLPSVMSSFSATNPPPAWAIAADAESPTWTLDGLFLLPKARLKYYRKLYSRLLKSTTPGKSDHRLLIGALDKLDKLLDTVETREQIKVGASQVAPEVVLKPADEPARSFSVSPRSTLNSVVRADFEAPGGSETSSPRGSSLSSGERLSRETASTSISRVSSATMTMPISDLERRLSTQRTLDIFTMRPKVVRLQMTPPTLQFTREFRFSMDAVVRFTPRSSGVETVHQNGHLFLLSDLFLICERILGPDGADMWLCYPPLAGKVLRVSEVEGQDNAIEIAIMRKETIIMAPTSNQPVPPMPPMPPNLSQPPERSLPLQRDLPPPPPMPKGSPSAPNGRLSQDGQFPPSSTSQPFFANPGHVVPSRSASVGTALSRGAEFQPPNGTRSSLPPAPPPPPFSNNPQDINPQHNVRRAPSAPLSGPPPGAMNGPVPPRPPSEPPYSQPNGLRKSLSARSLQSQYSQYEQPLPPPPLPSFPPGGPGYPPNNNFGSSGNMHAPQPHAPQPRTLGVQGFRNVPSFHEPSPPNSPVAETPAITGPITSSISAEMKCKVFLKQQHAQWKALGAAKLKLYRQSPTNIKQLVVEAGSKNAILISTIVLTDGVERLRSEKSAGGLFDSLLEGSDRAH
ncbi:hypothetical protein B0H16DRAFT_1490345 [Mycena metata]|uniref:DH domain-containing protein n=1 Tax=Mycena metata TaxID=1033252 RepID=A0AAD7KJP4_9AGAR|nr:hypothetical protein B0H16DRAFT_1490345 [Mycena metata]